MRNKIDKLSLAELTNMLEVMNAARTRHGALYGETGAYAQMGKRIKEYKNRIEALKIGKATPRSKIAGAKIRQVK